MAELPAGIERIRLLLLDVDGVLTDGSIFVGDDGREIKRFHVHDGSAIVWWKKSGHQVALLSGRSCEAVRHRADELGIDHVIQGARIKIPPFEKLLKTLSIDRSEVCYVGDDLPDLPIFQEVGLAVAPANACAEVREAAGHVTRNGGGYGAVREVVELVLRAQGRWESVLERYRP